MKKMLLVFAHPDDESFTTAGTVSKYVSLGWTVDLVCTTKGEAGERGSYDKTVDLAAIRQQELEDAVHLLGISSLQFLDYIDGTMKDVHPGELEDILYKIMLDKEPDIVITFEPNGISNHPDHMKVSLSTTFAFQKYAKFVLKGEKLGKRDPRRKFVTQLGGYTDRMEPKLYFTCVPDGVASYLIKQEVFPKESFGKPWRGVADKMVTTVIDVTEYTEKKIAALAKHKTQLHDVERFVSIESQPLAYTEYFILRYLGEQEIFMGKDDQVANEL